MAKYFKIFMNTVAILLVMTVAILLDFNIFRGQQHHAQITGKTDLFPMNIKTQC